MVELTQDKLKELLSYDEETGLFTNLVTRGSNAKIGSIAGCLSHGYVQVRILGLAYLAHRLVWLYIHGKWPKNGYEIDHIDGNKANNKLSNIRLCTKVQNSYNKAGIENITMYRGVYKSLEKFAASIKIDGVDTYLGTFDTAEEAAKCYELKAQDIQKEFYKMPSYYSQLDSVIPNKFTKTNSTGYKGVSKTTSGKYRSYTRVEGKKVYLGTFGTAEEAYNAYIAKQVELGRKVK